MSDRPVRSTYYGDRQEGGAAVAEEAQDGIDWGVLVNSLQDGIDVTIVNLSNAQAAGLLRAVADRLDTTTADLEEWT